MSRRRRSRCCTRTASPTSGYSFKKVWKERFDQLELQCLTFLVQIVPDREEAVASLAGALSVSEEQITESPIAMIGTTDQIIETLRERREQFGFSYIVVHEAELDTFAPVVAALTGT